MLNEVVDIDPEFKILTRETMINKLNDKNKSNIKKKRIQKKFFYRIKSLLADNLV